MSEWVNVRYCSEPTSALYNIGSEKGGEWVGTWTLEAIGMESGLQSKRPAFWSIFVAYLVWERKRLKSVFYTCIPRKWWTDPRSFRASPCFKVDRKVSKGELEFPVMSMSSTYKRRTTQSPPFVNTNKDESILATKLCEKRNELNLSNQAQGACLGP